MQDDIGRALRAADFAAGEVETFRRQLGAQRAEYHRLVGVLEADAAARREEAAEQRDIFKGMAASFAESVARSEAAVAGVLEVAQAAQARADDAHTRLDGHDETLNSHAHRLDKLEAKRWALWVLVAALLFGGGVAVGRIHSQHTPASSDAP